jgi:multidrug resistance efflux pump
MRPLDLDAALEARPAPIAQRMNVEATLAQAQAQLNQAPRILSPADGYVTNLLAQLGHRLNVRVNTISVVEASSDGLQVKSCVAMSKALPGQSTSRMLSLTVRG